MHDFRDYMKPRRYGFVALDFGVGKLSIQAGDSKYSEPRREVNLYEYSEFELAWLPGLILLPEGCPYRLEDETGGEPEARSTVYPYMSLLKVREIFLWCVEQYGLPRD